MIFSHAEPDESLALPFQQHPAYARALEAIGKQTDCLTLRRKGRRLCHAILLRVQFGQFGNIGLASLGPVWGANTNWAERNEGMREFNRKGLRLVNANVQDATHLNAAGYKQICTPSTLTRLSLNGDWRRLAHAKWRNRLNKGEEMLVDGTARIHTRPFNLTQDQWFLDRAYTQSRARRYYDPGPALAVGFSRALPEKAQFFSMWDNEEPLAGVLVLRHGAAATYHLAWSSDAGRKQEAHRLLLARAIDWLIDRGHTRLDLGLIDTDNNPGLARFKLGAGAEVQPTGGTWLRLWR